MQFPENIEHFTVKCPPRVDPILRFEQFRSTHKFLDARYPADVPLPPVSGSLRSQLVAYADNARRAVNKQGAATFPLEGNLCSRPGFIGPNPFGDGYGTGTPWAGMVILSLAEDGSFSVTIAWRADALGDSYRRFQKREMQNVKTFFESAAI